ncbi:MAG: two-component regulator propeller domain-containing protein [Anaerolineales bacterium]
MKIRLCINNLIIMASLFGAFGFPGAADAQSQTVRFETLTIEDGLSQNAVLSIAQDSQGFLWLGTEDGLNKYDGYGFTVYKHDPDDPGSVVDNFISELYVDREGELWIGTRSGLDRFDRETGSFIHYPGEDHPEIYLDGAWVISLFEDEDGSLWIGTQAEGLFALDIDRREFTRFVDDSGDASLFPEYAARVIFEDSRGNIWIGTHDGLDLFDRPNGTISHIADRFTSDMSFLKDVSALEEDRHGNLWIGTEENGLARFNPKTGSIALLQHHPDNPHSLSHDRVRSIFEDSEGNVWVGTQNGLNLLASGLTNKPYKNLSFQRFYNDPFDQFSLGSSAVWSILEDQSGILWFGTWGGGLSKYNRATDRFKLYQHYPSKPGSISDNMIWSILEDSTDRLWIGTLNGGLNMLDRTTDEMVHFRYDDFDQRSILSDDVRTLLEDPNGAIWIGSAGGLDQFQADSNTFKHFTYDPDDANSLSGDRVNVLKLQSEGGIWVGTRYDGLNLFNPETGAFIRYQHDPDDPSSLSDDRIWALYEDSREALWIGTLDGINVLQPGADEFMRYQHDPDDPDSLSSNSIFAFYEDSDGSMWVGTWGGGLDRFDPDSGVFEHFTENDGLPNDTIYGIEVDDDGYLWMSTNRGLSKFDPRTAQFQNYDMRDGLQDNEFNVGAHFRSERGELFFGGIRGFNAFFPGEVRENPHIPPIVITNFYKFNEPVRQDLSPDDLIELTYQDNFIAFEFSALDYYAPENNQYAYMLDGFDEDWVQAGSRRYVSYTNLEGGDYVFKVRGSNSDGAWNEEGATVNIRVEPPLWETPLFQWTAVILLVAVLFTGYRYWIRRVEARSKELEQVVRQRTHEIEARRAELDALYRADGELIQQLEVEQLFQVIVDIAVEILHANGGLLLYRDDENSPMIVRATIGFEPEALDRLTQSMEGENMDWLLKTNGPVVFKDEGEESSAVSILYAEEGFNAFMHMPILVDNEVFGLLSVGSLEPREFVLEEKRLFTAISQRASIAIEQAQLQHQAQQTAVYEERQRLARDLHDAVTQTLFSASIISEVLPSMWEKDPEIGRDRLRVLNELTKGALAEMRALLMELRPSAIEEADFDELLRQLVESTIGRARIPIELTFYGKCDLSADEKVVLYRIAQEALNNVAKHADASQASIIVNCQAGVVEMRIRDNGTGFDPETIPPDRLGLGIMHERATSIGAEFSVESSPGSGTEIAVTANQKDT